MCHGQGCRVFLGMGDIPPLMTESLFHGYINPHYWVDEFIPYYMQISWELIDPGTHGIRTCQYKKTVFLALVA